MCVNKKETDHGLTNYILTGSDREKIWDKADEIVRENVNNYPGYFNTDIASIPYEMRYVPPFEREFNELRNIQIASSSAASLFHEYNGYMIIDLTQYAGHETDYYLDISLKFFRDMASDWAYIFVINKEDDFCRQLTGQIALLFRGLPLSYWHCESEKDERSVIKNIISGFQTECSGEMISLLQRFLNEQILSKAHVVILINDIISRDSRLTARSLERYLTSRDNLLRAVISSDVYGRLIEIMKEKKK